MAKREIQEINAGSMADIAFLLLIFFLVTTTMDTDTGISRKLPPMPEEEKPKDDQKVKERNVFIVLLNRNNQLLVEGEPIQIGQLRDKTREFILNPENDPNLPEKRIIEVEYFGNYEVTKGVISLQNDRGTSYGSYIHVQNELAAAINELRNELSMQKFGKKYEDLDEDQGDAVQSIYPMAISEAEPKNIGE